MSFFKYIFIITVSFFLISCFTHQSDYGGKPVVVTTTSMIADIVRNVGGDFVAVETLIAPGIDPHSYKASERDVIKVASANLIFHNGLYLEGKLSEVLERAKNTIPSYAVSEYIPENMLIMANETVPDPHIWFDPAIWSYAINRVADSLVEFDPANAIYYRRNEDRYLQQLFNLNEALQSRLDAVPEAARVIVTSHDAFSYFGRAYGWEVIGIQGINTASETSVYSIQSLARTIEQRNINCIFTETSVPTRSVEALIASSTALGVQIRQGGSLYSDSLGPAGSGADTYTEMMNHNVNTIISGIIGHE